MGCSGGGGSDGGGSEPPSTRLGPEVLAAGMVFSFTGDYENDTGTITWLGTINKQLNVTTPTSGTWVDTTYYAGTGDSGLTYTRGSTGNSARIVATTYRFASSGPQVGTVSIALAFTSATGGTFKEDGVTDRGYTGKGTFVFTPAATVISP